MEEAAQQKPSWLRGSVSHLLKMALLYGVLMLTYPKLPSDLLAFGFRTVFGPWGSWDELHAEPSPDGSWEAASQILNNGALGWGYKRVTVSSQEDPEREREVFRSPTRYWSLEPLWRGDHALEILVHTNREPTRKELQTTERNIEIDGQPIEVTWSFRERRAP